MPRQTNELYHGTTVVLRSCQSVCRTLSRESVSNGKTIGLSSHLSSMPPQTRGYARGLKPLCKMTFNKFGKALK
jgi:hypothetical protein